jgi:hypothetical protein
VHTLDGGVHHTIICEWTAVPNVTVTVIGEHA